MTAYATDEYQKIFDLASKGDRASLVSLFDYAKAAEDQGDKDRALASYRDSAIAYRRAGGVLQTEIIRIGQVGGTARSDAGIYRQWIRAFASDRMQLPLNRSYANPRRVRTVLHEISATKKFDPLFDFIQRKVNGQRGVMTYCFFAMDTYFGFIDERSLQLIRTNECQVGYGLLALEVDQRLKKYSPDDNIPPSIAILPYQTLEFYTLLGDINRAYFILCQAEPDSEVDVQAIQLANLPHLTARLDAFAASLRDESNQCIRRLEFALNSLAHLCASTRESFEELVTLVEEDTDLWASLEEAPWQFEPLLWEDKIGKLLNEFVLEIVKQTRGESDRTLAQCVLRTFENLVHILREQGAASIVWRRALGNVVSDDEVLGELKEAIVLMRKNSFIFRAFLKGWDGENPEVLLAEIERFSNDRNLHGIEISLILTRLSI